MRYVFLVVLYITALTGIMVAQAPDKGTVCISGDCKNGNGQMRYPDGRVYVGWFLNGKPHFTGEMKYPDGKVYRGQFLNGQFHGKGMLMMPDGTMYRGEFENGQCHGRGVIYNTRSRPPKILKRGLFKYGQLVGSPK
jgi:hypothetical protein